MDSGKASTKDSGARRPLKARSWRMMQGAARWINSKNITPNQMSLASIAFSGFSALLFLFLPYAHLYGGSVIWICCVLIFLGFVGRGFCNVLDGLVAVEGGKSTPSGELFNDIPDRISDVLIIVAVGYAAGSPVLGWLAALLAVMTAYVRTLIRGVRGAGSPNDFAGPMAKLPRMLVITAACIVTPLEDMASGTRYALELGLIVIIAGCVVTMWNRAKAAYDELEGTKDA